MSCENLTPPKNIVSDCSTSVFGIPWNDPNRTVAGTPYEIQGIVLHCYPGTIDQLCNELKCKTKSSIVTGSVHQSYHYGIGTSGHIRQFVQDCLVSWTFGAYTKNNYTVVPPSSEALDWPVLQAINGTETTPDVYVLNVAIALGAFIDNKTGCFVCPSPSGLPLFQHDELVQLLAYLASEYDILIDEDHIQFHDLISCDSTTNECPCLEIADLLSDVINYCPPCADDSEAFPIPDADPNDVITDLIGITPACCETSSGCMVRVPFDGCWLGSLAADGDPKEYLLGLTLDTETGKHCLTRGCLTVEAPLSGCGTIDSPLTLDLCAWGDYIPNEAAVILTDVVGLDAAGCLIESPIGDVVTLWETDLTVVDTLTIDLTVSGVSDHTLQADLIVSEEPGNQVEILADGVFVDFDCDDIVVTFGTPGLVDVMLGINDVGACVQQDITTAVTTAICEIPDSLILVPTGILAKDDVTCPVFITPNQVVNAGFAVDDTDCIDLTWAANVLTAAPITDPATDNIFECNAGMYVEDLNPVTTDCIRVEYVGRELKLFPEISPAIGGIDNVIQCTGTGLYVPRGADIVVDVTGPITGDGSDIDPIDINFSLMDPQDLCDFGGAVPAGTLVDIIGRDGAGCLRRQVGADVIAEFLVVDDTNCIDLTLTGNVLTAEPIRAPTQGAVPNVLSCLPDGLYVPRGGGLEVFDSNCIQLDLTVGILSATLILDLTVVDNQLECNPNGMSVPPLAGLQVDDTNCIDLTLTGSILTADPIRNPDADNILTCTPTGLYVPDLSVNPESFCVTAQVINHQLFFDVNISGPRGGIPNAITCEPDPLRGLYVPIGAGLTIDNPNDCVTLALSAAGVLSAVINVSADDCNGVECRVDGLYVNNDIQGIGLPNAVTSSILVDYPSPGDLPAVGTEVGDNVSLTVTNPSDCNEMAVIRNTSASAVVFIASCTVVRAAVTVDQEWSNISAVGPWNSVETITSTVEPGQIIAISPTETHASFIVAPSASATIWLRTVISNPDGNFCGSVTTGDKSINATGVTVVN